MADTFAPQLGSEVRFNQPIEQAPPSPSAFGALVELGGFFAESFGKSRQAEAKAAPAVDKNLASFTLGLEKVEAIRQERGEAAALVAERQLASNFAMAGINFDASYEDVYTKTTGRQWAGYGLGQEGMILQKTLEDPAVQSSYIASFAVNKDWSEEQRIEYAIGQKATVEAANDEIAKSKAQAGYTWSVNTEAAYGTRIDTFLNTSLGALSVNSQQGGRVSPTDVQNLKAQWDQLKVSLSRPPNISDDQWKSTQDKLSNIDSLFTTFEKLTSSELLLEEISTGFANAVLKEGGDSAAAYGAAMAALKDPTTLLTYLGQTGEIEKLMMEIGKGDLRLDVTQPNLLNHIFEDQGSLTGVEDPNAFLTTIPSDIKTRIDGKTAEQIFNGLNASGKLAGLVKPADLIRPDAREQFVTNAATIGAVLMNNPSESFLSDTSLKQLIANPGFIRNIIALDVIDPEGAAVARQYVRSGLDVERGRQVTNFGSIEAFLSDKGIVWDGSAYVLSPDAQDIAGAVTSPGRRGFAPMPTIAGMAPLPMDPLQEFSGVIKQAMDRRAAIVTIDRAMKALEVPTAETTNRAGGAGSGSSSTPTNIGDALGLDFTTLEAENGLPQGYLERTAFLESGGDPLAQNPESSAGGLFQFIDDTAKDYGVKDRFDPVQATDGAVDVAVDNMRTLTAALGREPTGAELYLAHQQGGGGARALLSNTSANVVDALAPLYKGDRERAARAVRLNKGNVNMTAGEFASLWLDRFNNAKTIAPTAGTPANANAVASRAGEAVQRAVNPSAGPVSVDVNLSSGGAPAAPVTTGEVVVADATLPEAIPAETPTGTQGASELSPAIAVDQDVQAFIQEIAGDPDKSYASEAEFIAAQERGELEAGDTVVVNGEVYVVRKNGSVRKLGTVNS
jgi:hypothetical protein